MEANTPKNCQQTAIRLIPEDWEVKNLAEIIIAGPKNGYSGRSGRDARGTLTLRLTATSSGYLILNDETVKRLDEIINPSSELFLQPGDILIQRSNTYELVGTTAIFNGSPRTYIYPDLMMRLRFEDQSTAHWFWRYANSFSGRRFFLSVAAGSTGSMPKISGAKLRGMTIPFPPLPEQKAITQSLSDVDAQITALDQLITKKRNIKQSKMQQLLTGKKRLPGFSGEWAVNTFDKVMTGFSSGSTPSRRMPHFYKGDIKWITSGELNYQVINDTYEKITEEAVIKTNLTIHEPGTFFIAITGLEAVGTRGSCGINGISATTNQSCMALYPKKEQLTIHYLFYYYVNFGENLALKFCQGTKQQSYNAQIVKKLPIYLPPTIEEQKAIAQVLSDMDAEIEALEQKRDKYKSIKQGMMQELLTGKTRLMSSS